MKKVAVFLANGFEEVEAMTVIDYLRRVSLQVDIISVTGEKNAKGSHGIEIVSDLLLEEVEEISDYDALVLPGGMPGATNLRDDSRVISAVQRMNEEGRVVAAICAAPIVLEEAGVTGGKKLTSYPGFAPRLASGIYSEEIVCEDGNLITSRGPATAILFAMKLAEKLVGQEAAEALAQELLLPLLIKEGTK